MVKLLEDKMKSLTEAANMLKSEADKMYPLKNELLAPSVQDNISPPGASL